MKNTSSESSDLDYVRQVFAVELLRWKALSYEQWMELFPDYRETLFESRTICERDFQFYIRLLGLDANAAHAGLEMRTIRNKRNLLHLRFFHSYFNLFDDWIVPSGKDSSSNLSSS